MDGMPRKLPLFVTKEKTRHGKYVFYFRKGKDKRTRLPSIDDPKFKAAYKAALMGMPLDSEDEIAPKSIRWLIERHMNSAKWAGLSDATRKQQGLFFKQLIEKAGNENFRHVTPRDIRRALDDRKDTPFLANNYLKALNSLFSWAVENVEDFPVNPCSGVKRLKVKSDGHPPWTQGDVDQFRAYWHVGTMPRLALELMLLSGLRRSDIHLAGRQHLTDNLFRMTTIKTNIEITVEFPDYLMEMIAKTPSGNMAFITNKHGKHYTKESFGNWFGDCAREAGIAKGKNSHGLRKLAATMAANAGATSNELRAQFGWTNTQQADVYTKAADRSRLGVRTSRLVAEQIKNMETPHPIAGKGKNPKKSTKSNTK